MYVLILNPMTSNAENELPVARAETPEELIEFVKRELADKPYKDGNYLKTFKKDSPLEEFNPPWWYGGDASTPEKWIGFYNKPSIQCITREDWIENAVQQAGENFDRLCAEVYDVGGCIT